MSGFKYQEHEKERKFSVLGINIATASITDRYIPAHWHDMIEVIYCLNGQIEVTIEKKKYAIFRGQLIIIDSGKVHSIHSKSDVFMFIGMHISRKKLISYIPDIDFYQIECYPLDIEHPMFEYYLRLCQMAEDLTRIDFDKEATNMKSDGLALILLSEVLQRFSIHLTPEKKGLPAASVENIHQILTYINEHYCEQISLQQMADLLGFTKTYFCHYFKNYMGVSFLNYLNEVRISHAYQDLISTDDAIGDIIERNGITNQKVFNRTFKEIYGCTPREARKNRIGK